MNFKTISRTVGIALLVSALFMFFSILVSVAGGNDSALAALLISFTITAIVGAFPLIFVRRNNSITMKEGYVIIVLSWLLSFIFGMLPYLLWGGPFTVINAWFESVSGYTTTGATILENVEALPDSLLFWRSSTHFIGGLGIVVFLLLIIPDSSPIRLRLTNMELSSLSKDGYNARANKTIWIFTYVYLGLAVVAFLSYWAAGMSAFDAINHAFSVCSSGGFSTRGLSIGAFDSRLIEGLSMLFMILSSVHFGMVFMVFATRSLKPLNNPVLKFYLGAIALTTLVTGFAFKLQGVFDDWGGALWNAAFHTISMASTTGFAIADNCHWPMTANIMVLAISLMCGGAGSTCGAIKADRILVLFKAISRQISSILHPSAMNGIRIGKRMMKEEQITPQILYIALYVLILVVSVVLSVMLGVDSENAIAASLSSLGNQGPALGLLGTMGNFNSITEGAKILFTIDMFIGRIEIYPVVAVLAMLFSDWRK